MLLLLLALDRSGAFRHGPRRRLNPPSREGSGLRWIALEPQWDKVRGLPRARSRRRLRRLQRVSPTLSFGLPRTLLLTRWKVRSRGLHHRRWHPSPIPVLQLACGRPPRELLHHLRRRSALASGRSVTWFRGWRRQEHQAETPHPPGPSRSPASGRWLPCRRGRRAPRRCCRSGESARKAILSRGTRCPTMGLGGLALATAARGICSRRRS